MDEPTSYSIVQITETISELKVRYERLAYHYLSIDHALEHMSWAGKQLASQAKEKYPGFLLRSIDICCKNWNETQHCKNPPLEKFAILPGEKVPTGGHTFKSI